MGDETKAKGQKSRDETCETCASSYYCSQLALALKILDEDLSQASPAVVARYEEIKRLLAASKWAYPHGTRHCTLAPRSQEVRQLTDELIRLAAGQTSSRRTVSGEPPASFYEEETSHE